MYKVKELMNKEVVFVDISTPLKEILKIFDKYKFHTLPVVNKNKLVGIIEWDNIFQIFKPHPKHIEEFLSRMSGVPREFRESYTLDLSFEISPEMLVLCIAADLMETDLEVVYEDESVSDAYEKMKRKKLRCLPVVDRKNNLVGIITLLDIIFGILKKKGIF